MIQQKLHREASTGRVRLAPHEEEKHSRSSSENSRSGSSSARFRATQKYTSTNLIQPARQRLSDITVKEETIDEIKHRKKDLAASWAPQQSGREIFDPKTIIKASERPELPRSLLDGSQVE
jgi:ribosomal protein L19E